MVSVETGQTWREATYSQYATMSPSSALIASCSIDHAETFIFKREAMGTPDHDPIEVSVRGLRPHFSRDETMLATCADTSAFLYDAQAGYQQVMHANDPLACQNMCTSPDMSYDSRLLLSGGMLWDVRNHERVCLFDRLAPLDQPLAIQLFHPNRSFCVYLAAFAEPLY